MTLADYLRSHDLSAADFGRVIEVSRQNVARWARGAAVPRPGEMARITQATRGKVTANDFYSIRSLAKPTPDMARAS